MTPKEIHRAALAIAAMRRNQVTKFSIRQERRRDARKRLTEYRYAVTVAQILEDAPDADLLRYEHAQSKANSR